MKLAADRHKRLYVAVVVVTALLAAMVFGPKLADFLRDSGIGFPEQHR
ncbi:hypothetical protein [Caulobacter sp. 17J65-9]|nr:hypothetical protein [Caulobacter sp. 17J65-9]NEX94656.1 hypothetical protein [Caulobacter sp. 17J65-9]